MKWLRSNRHNALLVPRALLRQVRPDQLGKFLPVLIQGQSYVAVPHNLDTMRVLAKAGLRPPGPIRFEYDWPIRPEWKPFPHQVATADFLTQNPRAFVFSEIGTSKTLAAIWAADYLQNAGRIRRVLIITTMSTLWNVWERELFFTLAPRRKSAVVLHGTAAKRKKLLDEMHDFYIINHEGLRTVADELESRADIDHVIVDEGARYRNSQTDKYEVLDRVVGPRAKPPRSLWWMTGSPMPHDPTDAWAQARMVNPSLVPRYYSRFRNMVMVKVSQFKWVPRKGWEQMVFGMLKPSVRYLRDKCIGIPPTMVSERSAELSKQQAEAYKSLLDEYMYEHKEGLVTAANEGVKLMKLVQVSTGAVYDTSGQTIVFDIAPKYRALMEIIEEAGNKAIVFTPFRHSIHLLEEALSKTHSVGVVHGDVSPKTRSEIFQKFQHEDLQILLAHPETMAHGVDLTASSVIIWWGPLDNFEIYDQANGRITRAGQTKQPLVIHLAASEAERRVYKRMSRKESLQGLLLELLTTS